MNRPACLTHWSAAGSTAATKSCGALPVSDPQLDPHQERLRALEERIAKAKGPLVEESHMKKDYSQVQHAWRMVTELVAGLLIGLGIGYGLDWLFGTMPLFLVLFIGFGFIAGVKTMLRSAKEMQDRRVAQEAGLAEEEKRG